MLVEPLVDVIIIIVLGQLIVFVLLVNFRADRPKVTICIQQAMEHVVKFLTIEYNHFVCSVSFFYYY